jgi:AcrR family transcriptional regulator
MTAVTRSRKTAGVRRAEIVDAALRLAGEIGPDRLTTEALARAVGISQPAIFRHFPRKGDIWQAVAERIGEQLQAKAAASDALKAPPADQLRHFVRGHLAFIEGNPAIPAILFSRELHAANEPLRAFFAGLIGNRQRHFSRLIRAEIEAGRFDPALDADDAAYLVLALIQGAAMRWSLNARGFDLVAEGARLLELLLRGFLQRNAERDRRHSDNAEQRQL